MSKFTEQLKKLNIYNSYSYAGKGNVFINYTGKGDYRSYQSPQFQIIRPGYQTDPDSPWYNNGNKTFLVFGKTKPETLEEAKKWASERYEIKEWEKTPYGSWMDKTFVKNHNKELKKQLKEMEKNNGNTETPLS